MESSIVAAALSLLFVVAGVAAQCDQAALGKCAMMMQGLSDIQNQQNPDPAMLCKKVKPVLECFANLGSSCPQLADSIGQMEMGLASFKTMCGDGADDKCSMIKMGECNKNVAALGQMEDKSKFDPATHCPILKEFMMCIKPMESCTGQIQQIIQEVTSNMSPMQSMCTDAEGSPESEGSEGSVDDGKNMASATQVSVLLLSLSVLFAWVKM